MNNKITEEEKNALIESVVCKLELEGFNHEVELIKRQSDLTKKYKKAQYYVREFGNLFNEVKKTKKLQERDLIILEEGNNDGKDILLNYEKEEGIINNIIDADIISEKEIIKANECDIGMKDILIKALKFGILNFKKEFIEKCSVETINIGIKDNCEIYYCNDINNFIGII